MQDSVGEVNRPEITESSKGKSHSRRGSPVRNFQGQVAGMGETEVQAGS